MTKNILITGAAGNLGGLLARHILAYQPTLNLILMQHKTPIPADMAENPKVTVRYGDLSRKDTLYECLQQIDVIVHFAGVLFKANPQKFLYETNIGYFKNLVDEAAAQKIKKVILISFPHVEGPSSILRPLPIIFLRRLLLFMI